MNKLNDWIDVKTLLPPEDMSVLLYCVYPGLMEDYAVGHLHEGNWYEAGLGLGQQGCDVVFWRMLDAPDEVSPLFLVLESLSEEITKLLLRDLSTSMSDKGENAEIRDDLCNRFYQILAYYNNKYGKNLTSELL